MRSPRMASLVALALAGAAALAQTPAPPPAATPPAPAASGGPTYSETIDVRLATLVVRVEDRRGDPLTGLGATDFRIFVGRRELPVEAIEWVGAAPLPAEGEALAALEPEALEAEGWAPPAGRLVVFFVQADFHPSRMRGQLRMLPEAQRYLGTLGYEDSVAVVSFDSHLKLRLDFTRDRDPVRRALEEAIATGREPYLRRRPALSLARGFDFEAARRAAKPERGLELTARALEGLPGEKVVVYLGWGLGRFGSTGVTLPAEYFDALDALRRARATVFVLDVTEADYHSLEAGLREIALDTGGTYSKTHQNPRAAIERMARTSAGHYVLYYRPPVPAPAGELRVELRPGLAGEVRVTPTGGS